MTTFDLFDWGPVDGPFYLFDHANRCMCCGRKEGGRLRTWWHRSRCKPIRIVKQEGMATTINRPLKWVPSYDEHLVMRD
jgi:hypothetical protein